MHKSLCTKSAVACCVVTRRIGIEYIWVRRIRGIIYPQFTALFTETTKRATDKLIIGDTTIAMGFDWCREGHQLSKGSGHQSVFALMTVHLTLKDCAKVGTASKNVIWNQVLITSNYIVRLSI